MRRLMWVAAFAVVLAVPVWAQRGGGHAGLGGSHIGAVSGHGGSGRLSSGYSSSHGAASFSHGYGHSPNSGYSHNLYVHNGYYHTYTHTHVYTYGIRNPCYGYACRGWGYSYPWWGAAYYPWWWDEQDRQFDEDYYRQYEIANEMNRQSLEEQRMRRQEQADRDQDAALSRNIAMPASTAASQTSPTVLPTTLVFRDHRQKEVGNYAIVGNTLVNYSSQRTEKIALADLDIPATEKANEDRGVSFRIPGPIEGQ
jgi:hypothetical protein